VTALESAVQAAEAADLLPARRADEAARMERPFTVVTDVVLGASAVAGEPARYLLIEDARGVRFGVPGVIEHGCFRRAVPGDGVTAALGMLLADGVNAKGLRITRFPPVATGAIERSVDVDQTNELVVLGEQIVVKWFLHPMDEEQPAPMRLAALARSGFRGTPRLVGLVEAATAGSLVAMVTEYVPDTRDGWEWAVEDVREFASGEGEIALDAPRAVGGLVAAMHLGLATAGEADADETDVQRWVMQALADVEAADLDPELDGAVRELLTPLEHAVGSAVIGTHGDLHIGQILRSDTGEYYVIDFDGSPMLDVVERMRPAPPAGDVAGMLASLDHVGRVVLHRSPDLSTAARERVLEWIEAAQGAFLDAYRSGLRSAGRLDLLNEALLLPFQALQECREYAYAARYLPHWRYVPESALPALLTRGAR
jgi:maltokinase